MAGRSWGRNNGPGYASGGYLGPNAPSMNSNMGYFMPPVDRRAMYSNAPVNKPYGGAGYRDDAYRRPRDDYRAAKRPRGKSPMTDRRSHGHDNYQHKDRQSNRRNQHTGGRYEVRVPKCPLTMKSATIPELKLLHHTLSVPSDFSKACFTWQDAFPMYEPMKIATNTELYISHRDVQSNFVHVSDSLIAPDADYSYSVRVMPIASPELGEFYKHTVRTADEQFDVEKSPAVKNIQLLVGGKSKSETLALGGPWSPSLDGPDPGTNPRTLINTAIRTFKALTGVDLSSVTEWVRFMELRYYRNAGTKAPTLVEEEDEREIVEDGQEVVVFLVPNMSHLMPTNEEWEKTRKEYADIFQKLYGTDQMKKDDQEAAEPQTTAEPAPTTAAESVMETSQAPESTANESQVSHAEPAEGEPTHYSKLDISNMKVTELRAELSARNLDSKGIKAQLVSRLQNALEDERKAELMEIKQEPTEIQQAEEAPSSQGETASAQAKEVQEQQQQQLQHQPKEPLSEKDRRRLERLYRLGDRPAILIHPNRAARGGRFDCHRVSLNSLLSYHQSEEAVASTASPQQKELSFEVYLFAEQFFTMMQRDCAFTIFRALYSAPEKDGNTDRNGNEEPDAKRRKTDDDADSAGDEEESGYARRKLNRTVDPELLAAFTFYDLGRINFIRDHDLVEILHYLDLGYSKAQMKKLVGKVSSRDVVRYRALTDRSIIEGDSNDIINRKQAPVDTEFLRDLAAGNDLLFGGERPEGPSKVFLSCGGNGEELVKRVQKAEEAKKAIELQFFQTKEELERTRSRLNAKKETEDRLRRDNHELADKLREEQRIGRDNKGLVISYTYLLKRSRDSMAGLVSEIDKQFEKKVKRDSEASDGEKQKREGGDTAEHSVKAGGDGDRTSDNENGTPKSATEKAEWEVIDQV